MAEIAWRLKSGSIDEIVRAADQFTAWDTLCDRPVEAFGLIVTAEPNESADPIAIRTSALMFSWGRDKDAADFVTAARLQGLSDTTEADRAFAASRGQHG